jgi:hypothetical protein
MKPMTGAAVLGLVPIPPNPDTDLMGAEDDGSPSREDQQAAACSRHEAAERLATAEELARLRRELGIGVKDPGDRGQNS